jgi:CHAT domain-containing protein/Leucine-rich repeat (LRR) protein/Tfp pilus assembly protein PilF
VLRKFLSKLEFANRTRNWNCNFYPAILAIEVALNLLIKGHFAPVQAAQTQQIDSFNSFAEWCLNKDRISEAARHTVEVLLREAKTSDCQEANNSLINLTGLELRNDKISDLRPLSNLTNLTALLLENNQISDLRPLSTLTNLDILGLKHNQISDIKPLSTLTNLTWLLLENNQISDLRPLSTLTKLEKLDLKANQISDLRPLSTLTNLTWLLLENNQISDIKPLSTLTNLTKLELDNNQISDIRPLSTLTKLIELWLPENQISDIKPLATLTNLGKLILWNNPIAQKTCPINPLTICDFSDDGETLYKRAQEQYQQGEFQLALTTFQELLTMYQKAGYRQREGEVLNQMGDIYSNLGQYAQALKLYQQALPIRQQLDDRAGKISTLASLGIVYERLGQYQKSLQVSEESLRLESNLTKLLQGLPVSQGQDSNEDLDERFKANGARFKSLASVHDKLGNYPEALNFARLALVCYRRAFEGYYFGSSIRAWRQISGEVNALDAVGVAYWRLGNPERALMFLQRAWEQAVKISDKAGGGRVLNHGGELYFSQGENQKALEFYQQALPLRQQANDIAGQGETLNNLGLLHFTQNQYPEAEKYLFDAIKVLEALRPGLKDDEKIAIFETQTVTYRLLQKVLIAQNKYNEALEISDRARARAFVELLAQRFSASDDAQITPLTLQQIQRIAKEQNATLVEYSLVYDDFNVNGKQQPEESELYIWVIQPTGEITFRRTDLKPLWQQQKTSLSQIVGEARCFENDACRQGLTKGRGVGNIPEIRRSLGAIGFNNAPGQSAAAAQGQQQNRQLQQLHQLLIAPIADILPKDPNNRVIFIPQSSLFLAPFPALQDEKGTYLIEKHTILTAPSIQVLDLTHQQRQKLSPSIKDALVVGNPTMPTVVEEIGKPPQQLSPLLGAETEAKEIAQLLNTTPLIGNQATESVVVQKMLGARIIHLATHGSFDPERGIGSWIALAPDSPTSGTSITPPLTRGVGGVPNLTLKTPIAKTLLVNLKNLTPQPPSLQGKGEQDTPLLLAESERDGKGESNTPLLLGEEQGEGLNPRKGVGDGLLKAEEIVDLKLNAELVALSACDTAQGKITGDGVVGLSRALISAGVPSVLVSLWKVDDNATAFLMREFYQNWQKSGDKAQALRQAMLATKQKQNYSHPRFWAAFTLIGEAE